MLTFWFLSRLRKSVVSCRYIFPLLPCSDSPSSDNAYKSSKRDTGNRSSHQRCSMKKGVLRNFTKFTGKHLCQSLFFNKVTGLRPATLLEKRLWHRCFPVNFVKFLRTPFLQNTSGRLLLGEIVELISCQTSDAITVMCVPKR